jgi:maleamate amidohydrolase
MPTQDELRRRMDELGKGFDSGRQHVSERWGAETQAFYEQSGIGGRVGFGANPAVLIVDMQVGLNDPSYKIGADQTPAVEAIAELLPHARRRNVLVVYVRTGYLPDGRDGGVFIQKIPGLIELQLDDRAFEIDQRIAPEDSDIVIGKKYASAFFETNLPSLLVSQAVDTIVLTGCSTSGCIRAAAIDGVSHGYRVIVPLQCVADRAEGPHWANLFDINAKYGDVGPLAEVVEYLDSLSAEPSERREATPARR